MDNKDRIDNLEFRIFELEQNIQILTRNFDKITEELNFYYNKVEDKEFSKIHNRENLLDLKQASEIFNYSVSELNDLIDKGKIETIEVSNQLYFDKIILKKSMREIILKKIENRY